MVFFCFVFFASCSGAFCSVVQWVFLHHAVVFFVFVCIMLWCFLLCHAVVFFVVLCSVPFFIMQWCFLLCHAVLFLVS